MLVLRGEFGLAKKPRPTFGCPSVNHKFHDPDSPLLLGHLKETDIVQQGMQKTMLAKADDGFGEQLELKL